MLGTGGGHGRAKSSRRLRHGAIRARWRDLPKRRVVEPVGIAEILPDITPQGRARLDRAMAGAGRAVAGPPLDELLATRDALLELATA